MALNLNGKLGIEIDTSKLANDIKAIQNATNAVDTLSTALDNVNKKKKSQNNETQSAKSAEEAYRKLTAQLSLMEQGYSKAQAKAIASVRAMAGGNKELANALENTVKKQIQVDSSQKLLTQSAQSMNRAFDVAKAKSKLTFDGIAEGAKAAAAQNERLAGVVQRAMVRQVKAAEGVIDAEDRIRVKKQETERSTRDVVTAEQRAAVAALGVTKNVNTQADAWRRLSLAIRTVAGVKIFQQKFDNAQVSAFANQISRVAVEMQKAENATIKQTRVLQQANVFMREGVSSSLALAAAKMRIAGASDQVVRSYIKESQELSRLSTTQTKTTGSTNALTGSVGRLVGAYAGFTGVQRIFGALVQNVRTLDQINAQFLAVSGTAATVDDDFAKVEARAKSLALPIAEVARGFSRMAIAARGTALEGEALDEIFAGITTAQAALRFSSVETGRVFRAFEQIISKGKVSAEEVRQQLGDQIPGAFILFANAAKKAGIADTVAEFDKLIAEGKVFSEDILPFVAKELENTFGPGAKANVQSLAGAFNLLNNSLFNFFRAINEDLGLADAMANAVREVSRTLDNVADSIKRFSSEIKLAISVISTVTTVLLAAKGGFLAAAAGAKIYTAVSSALIARQLALATGVTAASAATLKLNAAMLALAANPVGFVLAGLGATLALVVIEMNKINKAKAKLMENSGQAFDLGSEAVNNIRTLREEFGSLEELPTEIAKSLRDQLAPATDAVSSVVAGLTNRREELERTLKKSRGNNANRERQLQNLEDVNRQLGVQTSLLNVLTRAQKEASEAAARPPLVARDADLQKILDEIVILEKGAKEWKAYNDQIEFNSFLAKANRRDLKEGTEEYNNFFANWLKHRKLVDDVNNSLKDNNNSTKDVNKSIRESIAEQNAQIAALQKGLNVEDEVLRAKNRSAGVNQELTEKYIEQRKALQSINEEQKRREDSLKVSIQFEQEARDAAELLTLAQRGYSREQASSIVATNKLKDVNEILADQTLKNADRIFKANEAAQQEIEKAAQQAADAQQRAYERAAEGIEGVFRGLFRSIFDGFDSFTDQIKDSFKDLLVELALQSAKNAIIIPVVTSIGKAAGLGAGAISGVTNALGGASASVTAAGPLTIAMTGLTNVVSSAGGAISDFGFGLTKSQNALSSFGDTIVRNSAAISRGLAGGAAGFAAGSLVAGRGPFSDDAGSLIGAGAALGSVVPGIGTVAGAIGGAVISAFKGNTKVIGRELTVTFDGMFDAIITTIKKKSSITGSSIRRSVDEAFGLDRELNDAFEQALRSTRLNLNLFGEVLEPQDFTVTEDFRNKSKEEVQAILEDIIGRAVASAAIPDLLGRAGFGFDAGGFEFGFEQDLEEVQQRIRELESERGSLGFFGGLSFPDEYRRITQEIEFLRDTVLVDLGNSIENLGEAAVTTLTSSFGSFENAQSEIANFISNFVTESQQLSDNTESLIAGINNVINDFGLNADVFTTLPSADQFRELALGIQALGGSVDQIDTKAEADALAALLLFDDALLNIIDTLEQVSKDAFSLRQAFDLELGDFEQALLELGISTLPNTTKGMQDLIMSLTEADQATLAPFISDLQGIVSEAQSELNASYDSQTSALQSTIGQLDKFIDSLRDFRNTVGQTIADIQGESLDIARNQFEMISARARTGDQEALDQIIESGQRLAGLSAERSVSREDYVRDLARIQREVLAVENTAVQERDIASESLIMLESQRDALLGIDSSILSVRGAVEELAANQAAYSATINNGLLLALGEEVTASAFTTNTISAPAPVISNTPSSTSFNTSTQNNNVSANEMLSARLRSIEQKIETGLFQIAKNTNKTNKLQERWDIDGLPEQRNVA